MEERGATQFLKKHVLDAELCTYCGACVNICPHFIAYHDRIIVRDTCDRTEGGCIDICPRLETDYSNLIRRLFDEKDITPEVGAVKAFYITRAADEAVQRNAQHGGTVTALIRLALEEGLIDTAVLSGETEPLRPAGVAVDRTGQPGRYSKSRFVVSPNVAAFNELAQTEAAAIGMVVTPCQAQALAKMRVSKNPRIQTNSKKERLVIGLFCGWAFSHDALSALLAEKLDDLSSIIGMDIPPSKYHVLDVFTADGTTISISLDEVQKCVRPACRSCSDMTAEFSDISVGSARLPEGWEEARSWNQVIVRTDVGAQLMDLARSRGLLEFREVPEQNLANLKKASLNKKKTATT
ncbi:MAG: Coenzyme F420 hydrogenase/dehydrogenase, beta subunit C-terminal domain [Deltaproteobacteria bacterium]|nr:Coenzyme F420 hydrogenase/dehydrogenase, beta subunit C-terminal domain [Deltaproteobacteria bacterium]